LINQVCPDVSALPGRPRLAVKAMSAKFCARVEVREGLLGIFLLDTPIAGIIFMMSENDNVYTRIIITLKLNHEHI